MKFVIEDNKKLINDIEAIRNDVYKCAVEHGWWEEERNFGELLALIHSEITEAFEHIYHGRSVRSIYERDGKQEGVVIDLADVVIRALDIAGHYGFKVGLTYNKDYYVTGNSIDYDLLQLHVSVSSILEASRKSDTESEAVGILLDELISHTIKVADAWNLDLYNAVKNKAAFNWTRPYKHGKKF